VNAHDEHVIALLRGLRDAPDAPYRGAGPAPAREQGARRRRHQRVALAVAVVVLVVAAIGVVLGLDRDGTDRLQPATPPPVSQAPLPPTPSPGTEDTPSPGASGPDARVRAPGAPVTSLGRIDWANSVMNLPPNDGCPQTRVRFTDGKATLPGGESYSINGTRYGPPVYGDITGDGRDDAVVVIECHGGDKYGPESRILIAAFVGNAKGGPAPLGAVWAAQAYVAPVPRIDGGTVVVNFRPSDGVTEIKSYRWNGKAFAQVG
jgi:hypothetical protein